MYHIKNEQQMKAFGELIGAQFHGGEVIELIGDVGAGKTTLVKGLARGMGIDEDIQSPSFTISRTYDGANNLHLAHYDFYRLHDAGIMANELNEAAADKQTIVVVEWAEIVANVLPGHRLTLTIVPTPDEGRTVTLSSPGAAATKLVKELHDFAA